MCSKVYFLNPRRTGKSSRICICVPACPNEDISNVHQLSAYYVRHNVKLCRYDILVDKYHDHYQKDDQTSIDDVSCPDLPRTKGYTCHLPWLQICLSKWWESSLGRDEILSKSAVTRWYKIKITVLPRIWNQNHYDDPLYHKNYKIIIQSSIISQLSRHKFYYSQSSLAFIVVCFHH